MRLRFKTKVWRTLGQHNAAISTLTDLVQMNHDAIEEGVGVLRSFGDVSVTHSEMMETLGTLLVDLMVDVDDLALAGNHLDIMERIRARAEIATDLIAMGNERRKEEDQDG